MMINTIAKNSYTTNIPFQGNISKKILSGISSGIKNLSADTFSKEFEDKTAKNPANHIVADLLKYALVMKTDSVVKDTKTTEEEIKQCCISALKADKPYEKTIVYNSETKKIAYEGSGNEYSCKIKIDNSVKPNSLEIFHGHPQFKKDDRTFTLPISIEDFEVLNRNSAVKKITAFDINGNKSELSKTDEFVKLSDEQVEDLKAEYLAELMKALPAEMQKKYNYLIQYCKKHTKKAPSIMIAMYKQVLSFQLSPEGAGTINKFWEKYSKKYNLNYTCDF